MQGAIQVLGFYLFTFFISNAVTDTDLFHGHASTEHSGHGEVSSMSRVARRHHVLCIEHLLDELGHGQGTVLLAATRRQRGEAGHEEVQTWEWNHVDGQLT